MRRIEWQVIVKIGVHAIRESFRTRRKKRVDHLSFGMSRAIKLDYRLSLKAFSYRRGVDPEERSRRVAVRRAPRFISPSNSTSRSQGTRSFSIARRRNRGDGARNRGDRGVGNSRQAIQCVAPFFAISESSAARMTLSG